MRAIFAAVMGLTLFVAACAAGGTTGESGPRRNSNLITFEEIRELGDVGSAYDVIQRLRGNWLLGRGRSTPRVFVNGIDRGNVGILRDFGWSQIQEIRYTSPSDATLRYGTNSGGGVIDLITRG